MATKEEMDKGAADYADEFNTERVPPVQTEDDAFGLNLPPEAEEAAEGENPGEAAPSAVVVIAPEGGEGGEGVTAAGAQEGEGTTTEEGVPAGDNTALTADELAKERQRLKSWEGRLKQRANELGMGEGGEAGETATDEAHETPEEQAEEDEKGTEMPVDQAISALAGDFGDDFVHMIQIVAQNEARKVAGEVSTSAVGEVSKNLEDVISSINDDRLERHFQQIYDAVGDFVSITESPEFGQWLSDKPDMQKVVDSGSAKQVSAMIQQYQKDSGGGSNAHEYEFPDEAAGVRSVGGGVRLPTEPADTGDYADAWNKV